MAEQPPFHPVPPELVELIASSIQSIDLYSVVRTSSYLSFCVQGILYDRALSHDRNLHKSGFKRGVWAAQHRRRRTLTALILNGADVGYQSGVTRPLLEMVASWADKDDLEVVVKALIEAKVCPTRNSLRVVTSRRRTDLLQYLLDTFGLCSPPRSVPPGCTYSMEDVEGALWDAVHDGREPVVQFLCQYLDISRSSWTIEQTAREGLTEMMHMLIEQGARGSPLVLIESVQNRHSDLASYLLTKRVINPDTQRKPGGQTALHISVGKGDVATVRCLLLFGANPNVTGDSCETPLHLESSQEAVEIIKMLINYGAQADARDIHGCTPLDMARGKSDIEELLLAPRQLQYSCTFPGSGSSMLIRSVD
jgi:hypothetical protein